MSRRNTYSHAFEPASQIPVSSKIFLPVVLFASTLSIAATVGNFSGRLVSGPEGDSTHHWIYVLGNKGSIRRVDVSGAAVEYGSGFRKGDRRSDARESLRAGAQVHVTAAQNATGEWKASRVTVDAPRR